MKFSNNMIEILISIYLSIYNNKVDCSISGMRHVIRKKWAFYATCPPALFRTFDDATMNYSNGPYFSYKSEPNILSCSYNFL